MSEWDTDFVRRHMSVDGIGAPSEANRNRFDRWLAEHDREVAEKAWDEGFMRANRLVNCRMCRGNNCAQD